MSVAISSPMKMNVVVYAVQNDGVYLTSVKLQSVLYVSSAEVLRSR